MWCGILHGYTNRNSEIKQQINALYKLYCNNFTNQKRNTRLPIIHNAIALLTHDYNIQLPIRVDKMLFIQSQCNVNQMFKAKKINEKHHHIPAKPTPNVTRIKNTKKTSKNIEQTIEDDICNSKLNALNQLGFL